MPLANTLGHMAIHDTYENELRYVLSYKYNIESDSGAYHKKMSPEIQRYLIGNKGKMAERIRHRDDVVCVHRSIHHIDAFLLEVKARPLNPAYKNNPNLFLDVMPLAEHIEFGDKCLYICKLYNSITGEAEIEKSFWVRDICHNELIWTEDGQYIAPFGEVSIDRIELGVEPHRYDESVLRNLFGDEVKFFKRPIRFGSGDPFAVFSKNSIMSMSEKYELVERHINNE